MKRSIVIIVLLLNCFGVFGQKRTFHTAELDTSSYYSASYNQIGFGLSVKIDKSTKRINYAHPVPNQPNSHLTYLEGTKKVKLIGSIHKDSLQYYRYTIIEDDTKQIVNEAIPTLIDRRGSIPQSKLVSLDLGSYDIDNKKLTVILVKITNRSKNATVILYNKRLKPAKLMCLGIGGRDKNAKYKGSYVSFHSKDSSTIVIDENLTNIQFVMQNTGVDYLYYGYIKEKSTGKIVYQSNNWQYEFFMPVVPHLIIDAAYFQKSGEYEFIVEPKLTKTYPENYFRTEPMVYSFSIKNPNEKMFSNAQLIIAGIILTAIFGAILGGSITYVRRKNQKNLALTQQQKELSKTELNSIRSQLNPHFIFNALAGIQNLMNTNKIDEANRYLGKFARLTRNVLDHKELISLAEERALLEDYLQMEQFRFGFAYEIMIDEDLNLDNIEIPTMLLQPFVENAVKHGIAELGNESKITISFIKENHNLILKVKDNGKGFETDKNYTGLGLQLSKNRISLLNAIYQETTFQLTMESSEQGSEIAITLTQWL
jgi:two-component system LytT family sensor kinase